METTKDIEITVANPIAKLKTNEMNISFQKSEAPKEINNFIYIYKPEKVVDLTSSTNSANTMPIVLYENKRRAKSNNIAKLEDNLLGDGGFNDKNKKYKSSYINCSKNKSNNIMNIDNNIKPAYELSSNKIFQKKSESLNNKNHNNNKNNTSFLKSKLNTNSINKSNKNNNIILCLNKDSKEKQPKKLINENFNNEYSSNSITYKTKINNYTKNTNDVCKNYALNLNTNKMNNFNKSNSVPAKIKQSNLAKNSQYNEKSIKSTPKSSNSAEQRPLKANYINSNNKSNNQPTTKNKIYDIKNKISKNSSTCKEEKVSENNYCKSLDEHNNHKTNNSTKINAEDFLFELKEKAKLYTQKKYIKELEKLNYDFQEKNLLKLKILKENNKLDKIIENQNSEKSIEKDLNNEIDNKSLNNESNLYNDDNINNKDALSINQEDLLDKTNSNKDVNNENNKQIKISSRSLSETKESKSIKLSNDPNEYIKKINYIRKIIKKQTTNSNASNSKNKDNSVNDIISEYDNNNNKDQLNEINEKNSKNLNSDKSVSNNDLEVDSKIDHVYDVEGNFLFSYKKNLRTKQEIQQYIIEKKRKEREEKALEEENKIKESLNKFENLYNFNINQKLIMNKMISNNTSKLSNSKYNNNTSKKINQSNINNYKQDNKYNKNNLDESSILDIEEYQTAMYEIKNLLTNNNYNVTNSSLNASNRNFLDNDKEDNTLSYKDKLKVKNEHNNVSTVKKAIYNVNKKIRCINNDSNEENQRNYLNIKDVNNKNKNKDNKPILKNNFVPDNTETIVKINNKDYYSKVNKNKKDNIFDNNIDYNSSIKSKPLINTKNFENEEQSTPSISANRIETNNSNIDISKHNTKNSKTDYNSQIRLVENKVDLNELIIENRAKNEIKSLSSTERNPAISKNEYKDIDTLPFEKINEHKNNMDDVNEEILNNEVNNYYNQENNNIYNETDINNKKLDISNNCNDITNTNNDNIYDKNDINNINNLEQVDKLTDNYVFENKPGLMIESLSSRRSDNIIVNEEIENSLKNSQGKIELQKKIDELLNKSKSRDLSVSNITASKHISYNNHNNFAFDENKSYKNKSYRNSNNYKNDNIDATNDVENPIKTQNSIDSNIKSIDYERSKEIKPSISIEDNRIREELDNNNCDEVNNNISNLEKSLINNSCINKDDISVVTNKENNKNSVISKKSISDNKSSNGQKSEIKDTNNQYNNSNEEYLENEEEEEEEENEENLDNKLQELYEVFWNQLAQEIADNEYEVSEEELDAIVKEKIVEYLEVEEQIKREKKKKKKKIIDINKNDKDMCNSEDKEESLNKSKNNNILNFNNNDDDIDKLDEESAATILQIYMKNIYNKSIQIKYLKSLNANEFNKEETESQEKSSLNKSKSKQDYLVNSNESNYNQKEDSIIQDNINNDKVSNEKDKSIISNSNLINNIEKSFINEDIKVNTLKSYESKVTESVKSKEKSNQNILKSQDNIKEIELSSELSDKENDNNQKIKDISDNEISHLSDVNLKTDSIESDYINDANINKKKIDKSNSSQNKNLNINNKLDNSTIKDSEDQALNNKSDKSRNTISETIKSSSLKEKADKIKKLDSIVSLTEEKTENILEENITSSNNNINSNKQIDNYDTLDEEENNNTKFKENNLNKSTKNNEILINDNKLSSDAEENNDIEKEKNNLNVLNTSKSKTYDEKLDINDKNITNENKSIGNNEDDIDSDNAYQFDCIDEDNNNDNNNISNLDRDIFESRESLKEDYKYELDINNNNTNIVNEDNIDDLNNSFNKDLSKELQLNKDINEKNNEKECSNNNSDDSIIDLNISNNIDKASNKSIDKSVNINNDEDNKLKEKDIEQIDNKDLSSTNRIDKQEDSNVELKDISISFNINGIADTIADELVKELLNSEVLMPDLILPKKLFKKDPNVNLNQSYFSSYSLMNMSVNSCSSIKTIQDEKKEISYKLYEDKIMPKLVNSIESEINNNKLSEPYSYNEKDLVLGILTNNADLIKNNYNIIKSNSSLPKIDKQKILSSFEETNKKIRQEDNILIDNYYDTIVNECLIDAVNEIIEKERNYQCITEPLPWSNRTRCLNYKYNNSKYSKNKFIKKIKSELSYYSSAKMGLINDNLNIDNDVINNERDKKLINGLVRDLAESDELWKNHDVEETTIKLELTEMVLDQLLNEVVEIMEHVNLSRINPELYQYNSIYSCDDIPKLSFQQTENDIIENDNIDYNKIYNEENNKNNLDKSR